jgi:AGCS family alanine or glycine:cation symporter
VKRLLIIIILLSSLPCGVNANSINVINTYFSPLAKLIGDFVFYEINIAGTALPIVVLWLACAALFFTLYLRFISVRGFYHAIELIRGDYSKPQQELSQPQNTQHDANNKGEVSHFQALATAISGTVGIGNIGGVAIAITIGGAGATLWLIVAGFLGMSTKFVECVLGVKYRDELPNGRVSGGPMYYLRKGLSDCNWPILGRFMGAFYAIGIVIGAFGIGNMFQSNQAYSQLNYVSQGALEGYGWLVGLIFASIVFLVIMGGIKSIAKVTEKIVPFMALLYCVFALIVIGGNFQFIPQALSNIWVGAFSPEGVSGGAIGVLIIGFQRAVFSNEAGIGSASIAHSAVKTNEPVTEGVVSLLEPFIDTIVICTITALVIGTAQVADPYFAGDNTGIAMTSAAFAREISWFPIPLAFAAVLFAFSTIISWSYYGLKGWVYLVGEREIYQQIYKIIFCIFVALGCMVKLDAILDFSDAMVFLICVPNVLGMYMLAPLVKREMTRYFSRISSGEIVNYRRLRLNKKPLK